MAASGGKRTDSSGADSGEYNFKFVRILIYELNLLLIRVQRRPSILHFVASLIRLAA